MKIYGRRQCRQKNHLFKKLLLLIFPLPYFHSEVKHLPVAHVSPDQPVRHVQTFGAVQSARLTSHVGLQTATKTCKHSYFNQCYIKTKVHFVVKVMMWITLFTIVLLFQILVLNKEING